MRRIAVHSLFLLIGLALYGAPETASAGTYRYCLHWPVDLLDANFGEDYGTIAVDAWRARGAPVTIGGPDGIIVWGGLLDAEGCTGYFSTPYEANLLVFGATQARVGNNLRIEVRNAWDSIELRSVVTHPGENGTKYYDFPYSPRTAMIAVASYALQKFNGGLSNETFVINDRCRPAPNECCNCSSGGEIWIGETGRRRKFIIVHEIGHRLLGFWTGGYVNNCSLSVPQGEACYTNSSHSMFSKEYNSCAAMEGWAHFVAADVFNDHAEGDNPNAFFRYWNNTTVDVENGQRYMETVCNGDSTEGLAPYAGMGVELDWLRHWWDYHTNNLPAHAGTRPSHGQMMDEMDAVNPPWFSIGVYSDILEGILAHSGNAQAARWEESGVYNGVDH